MIHAKIFGNEVVGLTPADQAALDEMFPGGEVHLNTDNCPQVAEAFEKISAEVLNENRDLYRRLANLD